MQKNSMVAALVGAIFIGSAVVLALGLRYDYQARLNRRLQAQFLVMQNKRATVEALANETLEYSKRNPAINPILIQAGINPATKPVTK